MRNADSAFMAGCLMEEDCSDIGLGVTEEGTIQTGTAHPIRGSISRPYAPVPNTSNANNDANKGISGKRPQTPEMIASPLHQPIDSPNWEVQNPEGTG
ncbi:hypothetical protein ABOM_007289 [Aspergillus bombycis]|uniref:Uncharacterized protein n=1 Tax=Aspergillus bombycis TaxID=109264 RepID=A0A1F7ZXC0_9EURO|nr:hypothetical protein ABOM_007289 [Aspergillus bombycis]OGM44106.1 hypothetical protein ABOM_007289 [Aspergillus bombycis]